MPLPTVHDFAAEASDSDLYAPLGEDWAIAVADVEGSTGLAAAGRSRDVNFVAAAAVAALSAAVADDGGEPACCQFGGDGAIAAIPPDRIPPVRAALAALAHWALHDMDVPIRVGLVAVADLRAAGHDARAALHEVGAGNRFGLFLGSGVAVAEEWVKRDPAHQIAPAPGPIPGLEGLSCRWRPVPASRGVILCVIADPVKGAAEGAATLRRLQADIERIVPTTVASPLGDGERLAPRFPPAWRSLLMEMRTTPRRRLRRFLGAVAESLVVWALARTGRRLGWFDPARYRRDLARFTDYRKAAGGPRFVLDVTPAEADAIEALLERHAAEGTIRMGIARADATTITCLVGDLESDRHVHFLDGADLGYWRASQALKRRFGPPSA